MFLFHWLTAGANSHVKQKWIFKVPRVHKLIVRGLEYIRHYLVRKIALEKIHVSICYLLLLACSVGTEVTSSGT